MKRAISMLLAIALACSFVFAGGAAAQVNDVDQDTNQDADLYQKADADVKQYQDVDQTNVGLQGGNVAYAAYGDATAQNNLDQTNNNAQIGVAEAENEGEINQDANQEAENEFEFDVF
ncbi:toxin transporter [Haloterrigena salifodinae]|uniref:toxin transporter n=1 Tax=Haloterrigena salifodinae TaxID=2675099 RepID=UPI000F8781E4|nr:toxin transporter [Haloterrigena salifodinae]